MLKSDNKHRRLATTGLIKTDVMEILRNYSIQATVGKMQNMKEQMTKLGYEDPIVVDFAPGAVLDGRTTPR
jgi:hypothetical protein